MEATLTEAQLSSIGKMLDGRRNNPVTIKILEETVEFHIKRDGGVVVEAKIS